MVTQNATDYYKKSFDIHQIVESKLPYPLYVLRNIPSFDMDGGPLYVIVLSSGDIWFLPDQDEKEVFDETLGSYLKELPRRINFPHTS